MREYHVRIYEKLGGKFPGFTRQILNQIKINMKYTLKRSLFTIFSAIQFLVLFSQTNTFGSLLEVGKPCPPIELRKIEHYTKSEASLHDFKGKWLIFDFWNKNCIACYKSFPKINKIRKNLSDQVEIILIGLEDKEEKIRSLYEKFRLKLGLNIPVVYDSSLFNRFNIGPCPYIIVIDDLGIIRALTISFTEEDIKALIIGGTPALIKATSINETEIQYQRTLSFLREPLLPTGENADFLYCSLLSKWQPGGPFSLIDYMSSQVIYDNRYLAPRSVLNSLYKVAYGDTISTEPNPVLKTCYGQWWPVPVLEMKDSSDFKFDLATGRNIFNYSLMVPKEKVSVAYFKECMQRDLKNYFKYDVVVETRKMLCWKVIATPEARNRLKTKAQITVKVFSPAGFRFKNVPVSDLIQNLWANFQTEPPFIDNTGITGNIDLNIEAILNDFDDFKKSLQKNGLDIIRGEKEMRVIVIKDPG